MQRLEFSGALRPLYGSLGVKGLTKMFSYSSIKTMFPFQAADMNAAVRRDQLPHIWLQTEYSRHKLILL